jgi:hypothetical protein
MTYGADRNLLLTQHAVELKEQSRTNALRRSATQLHYCNASNRDGKADSAISLLAGFVRL